MFHANMLKQYRERSAVTSDQEALVGAAVIVESEEGDEGTIVELNTEQKETYQDVNVNPELDDDQRKQVLELIASFQDIFSDVPKVTRLGEHTITLTTTEPV